MVCSLVESDVDQHYAGAVAKLPCSRQLEPDKPLLLFQVHNVTLLLLAKDMEYK